MMLPPLSMMIRAGKDGKNKFKFWFPVVLIWLVVFILAVALSPLVLIASLFLWPSETGKKLLLLGPMFFYLLSTLHGLNIQIKDRNSQFSISFF